jgi:hypothetical protein
MKKYFFIGCIVLVSGLAFAQKSQPNPDESLKPIQSTQMEPEKGAHSIRTMKIQTDEKGDEAKRKAFIDELRSLYKINFL